MIRGGEQKRIPGREVVKGDIIILREGDRIPADGVVLSSTNLLVDESLLTGESLAVRKCESTGLTHSLKPEQLGGDDLPFVYSGTLVIQGHGVAQVSETGIHTEMGKIGKALGTIAEEDSLLKKRNRTNYKDLCYFWRNTLRSCSYSLWFDQRRLAARSACGTEFEHGPPSRRVLSSFIDIPEYGSLAFVQKKCVSTTDACN